MDVVAFDPSWVSTGITQEESVIRDLVDGLEHEPGGGVQSLVYAALHPGVRAGDYVSNTGLVGLLPKNWLAAP